MVQPTIASCAGDDTPQTAIRCDISLATTVPSPSPSPWPRSPRPSCSARSRQPLGRPRPRVLVHLPVQSLVAHVHEDEAPRRGRGRAVVQLGPEEVGEPAHVLLARSHLLQGANDLAHHIPEKAVRPDIEDEKAVLLRRSPISHRLYRPHLG